MGDLNFDTEKDEFGRPPSRDSGGDFTGKLITWGLVSTRQQAEYVMVGLAVAIVIIAFFVYRSIPS